MANLRGGNYLYNDVSVSDSLNTESEAVYIGTATAVAIYIDNSAEGGANATFKIQASVTVPAQAGLNAVSNSMTWFDYQGTYNSGVTSLVVDTGATLCFDLNNFSPPFIRIVRTDMGSATTLTALVSGLDAD